mmetsp:Transcript_19131/g.61551  ORF Transcript_19131/g.61551 Transcript_19131/m.61551 type:complete len:256 (-) Transcript_19131:230-997(-)
MQKALAAGPDVATQGRLLAFVRERRCDVARCTFLAVDEVDAMVDLGFHDQVACLARRLRPSRRTFRFSALVHRPRSTSSRAPRSTRRTSASASRRRKACAATTMSTVRSSGFKPPHKNRLEEKLAKVEALFAAVAKQPDSSTTTKILAFVARKATVEEVVRAVGERDPSLRCLALHGDVDAADRSRAVRPLARTTDARALLVADVASRGLTGATSTPSSTSRHPPQLNHSSTASAAEAAAAPPSPSSRTPPTSPS